MTEAREIFRRAVGGLYSSIANRVYDRAIVKGTLPVLGGNLPELIRGQYRRAARIAQGRPILDMPVGTAHFTIEALREHDGVVVGVDLAEGMVRKARRVARDAGLDNLAVVIADAHRLPFKDASFATVTCANGLPVIPGLHETVGELARVLARDGVLFVALVTLHLSGRLPVDIAERLPAAFRSERDIISALDRAGLGRASVGRSRLAMLIESRRGSASSTVT